MKLQLLYFVATFALSLGLSLYLTPIIRRGAIRYGVLDHPDGGLKQQTEPVPYLGGIAVYLSFLVTLALIFDFQPALLGLLLGGTMMAMVGLFDDLHVLPAKLKLAGQLLAVWIVFKSGISIQLVVLPQWLAVALTVLWLVGLTNALNIIDVSDGLSSGVAAIAAVALFVLAVLGGDILIGTTTLALVGSLVGFLRYNQPPARIYLGDTGSLFIGFMLAALSMLGTYTRVSLVGITAPVLILAVPILDTSLVTLARLRRGENPGCGSPDHFASRLRAHGWSARRVAGYGYALGVLGAAAGVTVTLLPSVPAAWVAGVTFAVFLANLVWLWRIGPRPSAAVGDLAV